LPDARHIEPAHPGWDARQSGRPRPGLAFAISPGEERVAGRKPGVARLLADEVAARPPGWIPKWKEALEGGLSYVLAAQELPGAWFPALGVPRFVHGQSQGVCDLFGARVEPQPDGNYYVHPLPPDVSVIADVTPRAPDQSMYWGAVQWIRYARAATGGTFPFRNPVMTGPLDTANYLLGTTVLMDWVYAEPAALHGLLAKVTDVILAMLRALRQAAGGPLHGDAFACFRNALCLCSECRSLVSAPVYEEFEAPYLARIGRELGPYAIHSCGSWERTVASARRDPNLRAMQGQVRENDLAELCRQAQGEIILGIGPSRNLPERYTWPDNRGFLRYVLETAPADQPIEVVIAEQDLGLWNELLRRTVRRQNHRSATGAV
jgi:hypothetical protein